MQMDNDFSKQAQSRLDGLGRPVLFFESLTSTNAVLKDLARNGQAHGTCLVADYQSQGRGRMSRRWQASAGSGLLFSVLLRPPAMPQNMFVFTALAGLAVCEALDRYAVDAQIKWPNDVFLEGLKLCGMLSEIDHNNFLVIGIGVNVNQDAAEMNALPAISLKMVLGREVERAELLADILNGINRYYLKWLQNPLAWHAPYIERSWLLGKKVTVRQDEIVLQGDAMTVALDGSLLLDSAHGRIKVNHGDVSILAIDGKYK